VTRYPNLEEAVRVGEDLLPRLEQRERPASSWALTGES
jgi:hypothetical protein